MATINLSETFKDGEPQMISNSSQQATTSSPAQSPPSLLSILRAPNVVRFDAEVEGHDEQSASHRCAKEEAILLNQSQVGDCGAESERVLG